MNLNFNNMKIWFQIDENSYLNHNGYRLAVKSMPLKDHQYGQVEKTVTECIEVIKTQQQDFDKNGCSYVALDAIICVQQAFHVFDVRT